MNTINDESQARAVIRSVTGLRPGEHPEALEMAEQMGNTLIEAAAFLRNIGKDDVLGLDLAEAAATSRYRDSVERLQLPG